MSTLTKLACPLMLVTTFAIACAPAHAQFEGAGEQMAQFAPMMKQIAPMMRRMKGKMSNRQLVKMMQMIGSMSNMILPGGQDLTSLADMPSMESITSLMDGGPTQQGLRPHR